MEIPAGGEADRSGARVAFVDPEQTGLSTALLVAGANRVAHHTLVGDLLGDLTQSLDAFVG